MSLDTQLFYLFNNLAGQSRLADEIIVFLASYMSYLLIALFVAMIIFSEHPLKKKWEVLIVVGAASLVARFGATELIRFFYHRPRPFVALSGVHQLIPESSWSFPSGHATFFFAMATAVYLYDKKWGIGFFAAAALVGLARIVAGIHYPLDILGGALVGSLVAYLTFRIADRIIARQS